IGRSIALETHRAVITRLGPATSESPQRACGCRAYRRRGKRGSDRPASHCHDWCESVGRPRVTPDNADSQSRRDGNAVRARPHWRRYQAKSELENPCPSVYQVCTTCTVEPWSFVWASVALLGEQLLGSGEQNSQPILGRVLRTQE